MIRFSIVCSLLTLAGLARTSAAAPARKEERADYLFPKSGQVNATLVTGLPFPVLGEASVGIGSRVGVGVLGGATPKAPVFGVRPRVSVYRDDARRVVFTSPMLFYPGTTDQSDWCLVRPSLGYEQRLGERGMLGGGFGLLAAASVERLKALVGANNDDTSVAYGGPPRKLSSLWGLWNTVQATGAYSLSSRTSVFADGALILRGYRLAGDEWAGIPFTIAVGVTTQL